MVKDQGKLGPRDFPGTILVRELLQLVRCPSAGKMPKSEVSTRHAKLCERALDRAWHSQYRQKEMDGELPGVTWIKAILQSLRV
jgi:hypothetical protein